MAIKYPKVDRGRSVPHFQLTKTIPIVVERAVPGHFDEHGRYIDGLRESIDMKANVQPANGWDLRIFPESDRTEEWIKLYSVETTFTLYEGTDQRPADYIIYDNRRFIVKNVKPYKMGVLDHTKALAVRLPVINGGADA